MPAEQDDEEFGAPARPADVIPFPQIRANPKVTDAWSSAVVALNKKQATSYQFLNPLTVVDLVMQQRSLPPMFWPAAWPESGRRMRTYPGDMVGVVGSQGGGKTSYAIQICIANTAEGTPVIWAALELDPGQISVRIAANMHRVHAMVVRDSWPRARLDRAMVTVADLWHFIDRYRDAEKQIAAIRHAVGVCWEIYRRPPVVVVDHVGKLANDARDIQSGTRFALEALRELTVEGRCYTLALSQGSRANQATLTGKMDHASATDALGVAADSKSFEDDCANVVALALFKRDDATELDSHALIGKARWTGLEDKVGMRFWKAGGFWGELGYLPSSPTEIAQKHAAELKDKHRAGPAPSLPQVRADLNAARAGDAAAMRRSLILEALLRHGQLGMEIGQVRTIRGAGRGPALQQALQELERAGSAERIPGNKWRAIARME
jgi:KaiC/GvpD/RAD55 family RecA-like ATPase